MDMELLHIIALKDNRIYDLERFAKNYYQTYLNSRKKNEWQPISHNTQFFLYCHANEVLGKPNGKNLNE